jgi:hypothetical protein
MPILPGQPFPDLSVELAETSCRDWVIILIMGVWWVLCTLLCALCSVLLLSGCEFSSLHWRRGCWIK